MKDTFKFKLVEIKQNPNVRKLKGIWKCEILPMDKWDEAFSEQLLKKYSKEEIDSLLKEAKVSSYE